MSLILRNYQREAVNSVYAYWAEKPKGNPLIVLPTGGGKSLVNATLCQEFIEGEPTTRIVMATHVKELIEQNFAELLGVWPWAPAGIYSASLGRREAHAQILFGGIASMFRNAQKIGHVDILIIDEAHLVPPDEATMYGKFIAALRAINPNMLILGLTATPYRLGSGMLTEGDDALFDDICYEISIRELIDMGYLVPLVSKATQTVIDLKGLRKTGVDYNAKQLASMFDKHPITSSAVDEIIEYGKDRRAWLGFCCGVEHAHHVADEIRSRGFSCEAIYGDMDPKDRRRLINDLREGKIRALTNDNVLSTGTNIPILDLLFMLRKTASTSRYVQWVGRVARCIGPDIQTSIRNGKSNGLVLDFAGNVMKHGPVDMVKPKKAGKGDGEAPVKECPQCHSLIFAGLLECPDCGYKFERDVEKNIKKTADAVPIISVSKPNWVEVSKRTFYRHDKPGGTPSIRVEYLCGMVVHKEWICPEHDGFARVKFEKWWREHGGGDDAPFTIEDTFAVIEKNALKETKQILIRASGKFWEIVARKLVAPDPNAKGTVVANDNRPAATPPWEMAKGKRTALPTLGGVKPWDKRATAPKPDLDDEIPF